MPENAEKKRARFLAWHTRNPHKHKEYAKTAYAKYPEKIRERARANRIRFSSYYKAYWKAYRKKRYANNAIARISDILRSRLSAAIRGKTKNGSGVKDLGCSIEKFIVYMETLFKDGMSWENRGKWHIDHIRPLSSFDLTDRSQLLKACHYTNLQPLWGIDNIRKGAKLDFNGQYVHHIKSPPSSPDRAQPSDQEAQHVGRS